MKNAIASVYVVAVARCFTLQIQLFFVAASRK